MKWFLGGLAGWLAVAAVSSAADDAIVVRGGQFEIARAKREDNIDKKKLIGVWEVKKLAPGLAALDLPQKQPLLQGGKVTCEFKKNGTVKVFMKNVELMLPGIGLPVPLPPGENNQGGDAVVAIAAGKYEVDGNKLTLTMTLLQPDDKGKQVTHKITITKLTGKQLETKDDKGDVSEFKRKNTIK